MLPNSTVVLVDGYYQSVASNQESATPGARIFSAGGVPPPPPPLLPSPARGLVTIPKGKRWVLVAHGLSTTPDLADVVLTAVSPGLGKATYPIILGTNATHLQIGVDRDPGEGGARLAWTVRP